MKLLKKYLSDEAGQFAVYTALLGAPLILGVGLAAEQLQKERDQVQIKAALDSAALSAVQRAELSFGQKKSWRILCFGKIMVVQQM